MFLLLKRLWKRFWFLFVLPVVIFGAGWFPRGGEVLRDMPVLLASLVGFLLFISGFTLDARRLVGQALNVRAILLGVIATYALAPVAGFLLAHAFAPSGDPELAVFFVQGVMLAAAQSSTLATAITLTKLSGGNEELALVLTLVTSAVTAVLTPVVLKLSLGAQVSFSAVDMAGRILLVVVLPIILGQLLRRATRRWIEKPPRGLREVQQSIILVFAYVGFSAAAAQFKSRPALAFQFLGACAALHAFLLGATYLGAIAMRLRRSERVAVIYSGSQKSVPNGIYLWETYFSANPLGAVPLVVYQLCQLVVGFLLIPWMERSVKRDRADT